MRQIKDPELRKRHEEFRRMVFDPKTYQSTEIIELTKGYAISIPPDRTVIEVGETFESRGTTVPPSSVIEHLIKTASHLVRMNECLCRDHNNCKEYSAEMGCLWLGEAGKDIHPELGGAVGVEEALDHARRCTELGLVPCVGKMKGDAELLQLKNMDFLTICFCCSCCCLAKMFQLSQHDLAAFIHRIPGVSVLVTDACSGCEVCLEKCIFEALRMENDRAVIEDDKCKGCGRCAEVCPEKAIKINVEDSAYTGNALEDIEMNLKKS